MSDPTCTVFTQLGLTCSGWNALAVENGRLRQLLNRVICCTSIHGWADREASDLYDEIYAAVADQSHDNSANVIVQDKLASTLNPHPMLSPTHQCRACGALWRQCDDFSMNLRSSTCCDDCNNAPVGSQLVPLGIASQPVICTHDGSAVPDDSGGWFCADCGYVSGADQPTETVSEVPNGNG